MQPWMGKDISECLQTLSETRETTKTTQEKYMSHREQGGNWCVRREYPNTASTAHEMGREILE